MKAIDAFIGATLKGALIVFGLATCLPILAAVNLDLANRLLFQGLLTYTPASEPALRHWGLMVAGVGALMVAAAFYPWLQFSTLLFAIIEKVLHRPALPAQPGPAVGERLPRAGRARWHNRALLRGLFRQQLWAAARMDQER